MSINGCEVPLQNVPKTMIDGEESMARSGVLFQCCFKHFRVTYSGSAVAEKILTLIAAITSYKEASFTLP